MLKQATNKQASNARILQSHIETCMKLISKIVEMIYASPGEKYQKKNEEKQQKSFFGMFQNNNDKTNLSQQRSQLQPSAQTEIQSSLFKKAAVEFYSRNEVKLNVLKLVTEYKKFMSSSGVDNSDENKETDTTTSSDENQNKKKETVDLPSKSAPSIPTHNIKLKIIQKK